MMLKQVKMTMAYHLTLVTLIKKTVQGLPWQSSGLESMLSLQGVWVPSLVREIKPVQCGEKTKRQLTNAGEVKSTLVHCWWEYKLVRLPRKTVQRFLKMLKTALPCDPGISLSVYPEEMKSQSQRDTCTHVHCSIIHNSQNIKTTQVSTAKGKK